MNQAQLFADPRFAWLRRRAQLSPYGRLQIGQVVRWNREVMAPTNAAPGARPKPPGVIVSTEHVIEDIRETETGVALILRDSDNCLLCVPGIHYDGRRIGDCWDHIAVVREAPRQQSLQMDGHRP